MESIDSAIESVRVGVSLFSEAIGLVKNAKDILPESKDKELIEKSLKEANKAAKLAESQIALALGYNLCQCTFPPQIMLSQGYKEQKYSSDEEFMCPKCNKSSIKSSKKPIVIKNYGSRA